MTTIKRNSLLGLPSELRVRIYRYYFESRRAYTSLFLLLSTKNTKTSAQEDTIYHPDEDCPMVDDSLTFTCRLIRMEAMPELHQNLSLSCFIGGYFRGPGNLPIKPEYAKFIKKVSIEFATDLWTLSFRNLPSLELVVIESGDDYEPIYLGEAYQETLKGWAEAKDVESFVKTIKSEAGYTTGDWGAENTLDNKDRGFRILWKDKVRTVEDGEYIVSMSQSDQLMTLIVTRILRSTGTHSRCWRALMRSWVTLNECWMRTKMTRMTRMTRITDTTEMIINFIPKSFRLATSKVCGLLSDI